jgi:phosphatidate cytidylyltransferase
LLKQRIITAVVLVLLILGALAADSAWPFAALTLVLIAAAGWEWGRLNQAPGALSLAMGGALALAGGFVLASPWAHAVPTAVWWAAALLWVAGGAVALRAGPAAWPQLPRGARWVLGLLGLWAAWLALTQARMAGINFLLSVLALVWAADIAAYFAGRAFGRRKLAPSISPGKSWEGVVGGMVGVLALALLWTQLDARLALDSASVYTRLVQQLGWALTLPVLLALSGMSVVGDLVESLVKRAAGAKDSSRLLPGHGGVLDRVDALLPVLPLAMLAL